MQRLLLIPCLAVLAAGIVLWARRDADRLGGRSSNGRVAAMRIGDGVGPDVRRRPLGQALGAGYAPEEEHEAVLAAIRQSGEEHAPWTIDARATLDKWQRDSTWPAGTSVTTVECYVEGCVAHIRLEDRFAAQQLIHLGRPPDHWSSARLVVAPVEDVAGAKTALVLLNPNIYGGGE